MTFKTYITQTDKEFIMGYPRWTDDAWKAYSTKHTKGKSTDKIYTSTTMKKELNPLDITIRESRDSELNPESNAIIVGLDVTGSMDSVLDAMARDGLGTLASEIYDRKPVTDPHIMYMGIGDVEAGDRAPLQCTQFEADIKIAEQLTDIFLERMGGGNKYESYHLPWYFAATYTSIDCFEKRGKKGYLFTVGDEFPPSRDLAPEHFARVFGKGNAPQNALSLEDMLTMASRTYEVYHVIVEEGNCARCYGDKVMQAWQDVLGQRVIPLSDHTKLSEVIVSAIQLNEGDKAKDIVSSWDGTTSIVVDRALATLSAEKRDSDIVTFT